MVFLWKCFILFSISKFVYNPLLKIIVLISAPSCFHYFYFFFQINNSQETSGILFTILSLLFFLVTLFCAPGGYFSEHFIRIMLNHSVVLNHVPPITYWSSRGEEIKEQAHEKQEVRRTSWYLKCQQYTTHELALDQMFWKTWPLISWIGFLGAWIRTGFKVEIHHKMEFTSVSLITLNS